MVNLHHVQSMALTVLLVICLLPCCNLMKLNDNENGKLKGDENGKLKENGEFIEDKNGLYHAINGNWCGKCPAGEFVFKDCIRNSTKAQCKICQPGKFSMFMDGAKSCEDCTICDFDQDKKTECTTINDTVCVCPDNFNYEPDVGCEQEPSTSSTPPTPTSEIPPKKNETSPETEIKYVVIGACILFTIICVFVFFCVKRHRNKKSIGLSGEEGSVCKVEMEPLSTSAQNVQ